MKGIIRFAKGVVNAVEIEGSGEYTVFETSGEVFPVGSVVVGDLDSSIASCFLISGQRVTVYVDATGCTKLNAQRMVDNR